VSGTAPLKKRSVVINGHATSVTIEQPFWDELANIAQQKQVSVSRLIADIDAASGGGNLSSAIRVFVLQNRA
jgi:predicted DNA-binding ribbon-helix-helix protein